MEQNRAKASKTPGPWRPIDRSAELGIPTTQQHLLPDEGRLHAINLRRLAEVLRPTRHIATMHAHELLEPCAC